MKALLLILSLMAGCEVLAEKKNCTDGWVEFTCSNSRTNGKCQMAHVVNQSLTIKNGTLKVIMKNKNSDQSPDAEELKFEIERRGCPKPFHQTAYKKAKTTIRCDHPGKNYSSWFFCREGNLTCKNLTKSQKWTVTHTETGGFTVSISNVSSEDAGVYWCGMNSTHGAALQKINLTVQSIRFDLGSATSKQNFTHQCNYSQDIASLTKFICKGEDPSTCQPIVKTTKPHMNNTFVIRESKPKGLTTLTVREVTANDGGIYWFGAERKNKQRSNIFPCRLFLTVDLTSDNKSAAVGQNFTHQCNYSQDIASLTKFICKGEDPSTCQPIVKTTKPHMNNTFVISESKPKGLTTLTVKEVTANDGGIYWFGAERKNKQRSNIFPCRLFLTVESSTPSGTADPGSYKMITVIIWAVGLLLLLLLIALIFIYKSLSCLKNRRNRAAGRYITKDNDYEDTQEDLQRPASDNATKSIHVADNFYENHAALSSLYTTISFQNRSHKAGGEVPGSSGCEYATVKFSKVPTNSTVTQP